MDGVPVGLGVASRGGGIGVDAHRPAGGAQLGVEVLPLADPQVVEVLVLAHATERAVRQLLLLVLEVAPERVQGREVGPLVLEAGVRLVGLGLLVDGSLARVLDRQGRDDDEHLAGAPEPARLDDHPREPRVERESGERPAGCREPSPAAAVPPAVPVPDGERAELLEQAHAVGDLARVGRVDEREARDVAEAERRHLQDDRGERGALDLRLGELRPGLEVLLGVQPDADAGRDAAAATGALGRAGPAHRLDRQALHLGALAVARDAGGAGVDDVADAGHGERGLGDVGREDDPAAARRGGRPGAARRRRAGRRAGAPRCSAASSAVSASAASRISRSPEKNTRMSVASGLGGASVHSSSTASTTPVTWSRSATTWRPSGCSSTQRAGSAPRRGRCGRTPR